jgi:tetratricopeptide (TPR) repeat protein
MKNAAITRWLICILIVLFVEKVFAQRPDIYKLQLKIPKEANDTVKIKLMIQLGVAYGLDSREQIQCFNEVYALSKKARYKYGMAFGPYYEALQLWSIGRNEEALGKYKKCIDGLDSMGIIQSRDFPLGTIRFLFNEMGKQEEKYQYYSEKAAYYQRHGPKENLADCYHGIAGYYSTLEDYDKSIEYYMRAREIYKSFDHFGYATDGLVIGSEYLNWGNLEKAEEYLVSWLHEYLKNDEVWDIDFCYNKLGDLYSQRLDYKRALTYYYSIKKYWKTLPPPYIVINLVSIASVHLKLNDTDSAKIYLDRAEKIMQDEHLTIVSNHGNLEVDYYYYLYYTATHDNEIALGRLKTAVRSARSMRNMSLVLKYTNELHTCMLKRGDSLRALRYLVQYQTLQDSLNAKKKQTRIATFEIEQQSQEKENEIEQLQTQKTSQRNYYLIAGALLLLIVISVISIIVYKRKRDKEQLTTDFKNQLVQAETKALRAQMNPHFIFNSLNSINSFVMDQKHEIASDYLIKFSKLIRLILDNSRCELISIEKELETLKLYVVLESARFDNKFRCIYHIAKDINTDSVMIPPMLLQPFVENAIWHGLMQKEGEGTITIEMKKENEDFLNISITDDGIGREKAAELKSKSATHKSHGLKVSSQRIEMMNKLSSTGAQVHVIDLKDENGKATGTRVELVIPV